MSYEALRTSLDKLQRKLTERNHKEIKFSLIGLQKRIAGSNLLPAERTELLVQTQSLFEKVKKKQQEDKRNFALEASENYEFLKGKIIGAIEFTQQNIENHEAVWDVLVDTQNHFKGKKLVAEQREQLFGTLQKLFAILKKRRGEIVEEQETISFELFEKLDDEVEHVVSVCDSADVDKTWAHMLQTKDKVLQSKLIPAHRKRLIDKLQQGFDVLKVRRDARQEELNLKIKENALAISAKLKEAEGIMESDAEFKEKWDFLLEIQQEFKTRKLDKDDRNQLYDELQAIFKRLKSEQYDDQAEFERQADENFHHLSTLVDNCLNEAQNNDDLKKTKLYLIKVQADFKGRKMRSFEREKLFARLQTAFGILNKRISDYREANPEEPGDDHVQSGSDAGIERLEQELENDQQKLEMLENDLNELLKIDGESLKADSLQNQIRMMHTAMAKKNAELQALYQEGESAGQVPFGQ